MANGLVRWLRVTFDYNPAFPLSAMALLAGLKLLVGEHGLDAPLRGTLLGAGLLQAFELSILAVALLVFWPRRIGYETTSILRVVAIVRFASPFLAIRLAGEGKLGQAVFVGAAIWGLCELKTRAVQRVIGLDWKPWERRYDSFLFAVGAIGLPILGSELSRHTGAALSHSGARAVQLLAWWSLAILLAPLALGPEGLGDDESDEPLRSRRTAIVWRSLTAGGLSVLGFYALWMSGNAPQVASLLPLALVFAAIAATTIRSWGGETPWAHYVPASVAALALLMGKANLMGSAEFVIGHGPLLVLLFGLCAASVRLISREDWRPGARALGAVLALAPLFLMHKGVHVQTYLSCVLALVLVVGLARRHDDAVAGAALGLAAICLTTALPRPVLLLLLGAVTAMALAARFATSSKAAGVAHGLCVAPLLWVSIGTCSPEELAAGAIACLSSAALAHQQGAPLGRNLVLFVLGLAVARRGAGAVSPGVLLVGGAFAGIPLGTWVGLRRERLEREERAARLERLAAEVRAEEARSEAARLDRERDLQARRALARRRLESRRAERAARAEDVTQDATPETVGGPA